MAGLVTWLVLLLVTEVAGKAAEGGFARDTITRFMGLIVLSMGVQFALAGLHSSGLEWGAIRPGPSSEIGDEGFATFTTRAMHEPITGLIGF